MTKYRNLFLLGLFFLFASIFLLLKANDTAVASVPAEEAGATFTPTDTATPIPTDTATPVPTNTPKPKPKPTKPIDPTSTPRPEPGGMGNQPFIYGTGVLVVVVFLILLGFVFLRNRQNP